MAFVEKIMFFLFPDLSLSPPSDSELRMERMRLEKALELRDTIRRRKGQISRRYEIHREIKEVDDDIRKVLASGEFIDSDAVSSSHR